MAIDLEPPFVLLDDRLTGVGGHLYRRPVKVVPAETPAEVAPALGCIENALASGLRAAGFLAYEAGLALEPRLATLQ